MNPVPPKSVSEQNPHLKRALTLFPTTAIVIGAVVGSGIFVSSAGMAREVQSAPVLLLVWCLAGMLTFCGALTLCELASQMPKTGGFYEYFKQIYGEELGFFYGWANFMIAGSGAIAGIAYIFANYVGEFFPLPHLSKTLETWPVTLPYLGTLYPLADIGTKMVGLSLIGALTWLNVRGVKLGATIQSLSTTAKMVAILSIVVVAFVGGAHVGSITNLWGTTPRGSALTGWSFVGALAMATSGAFWSYDGWGNVSYIAGEVENPARTIPRALVLGSLSFIGLYVIVNVAYLYILPVETMASVSNDRVASSVVSAVVGPGGGMLVALLIILSTFDTVNATILTNGRVYYAMAHEKVFWKKAREVHSKYRTPHVALLCQGAWSMALLITGSFDLVTSMYVFVNWVFYTLMALGVFVLRFRHPTAARPFKVPGYPIIPILFTLFSVAYLGVTLVGDIHAFQRGEQPVVKSVMGLVLVLSGLPFYLYWKRKYVAEKITEFT